MKKKVTAPNEMPTPEVVQVKPVTQRYVLIEQGVSVEATSVDEAISKANKIKETK